MCSHNPLQVLYFRPTLWDLVLPGDQGKQGYQNSQNYRLQDFILSGDGLKTMRPGGRADLRDQ